MRIVLSFLFLFILQLGTSQDTYHSDLVAWLGTNYGIENPEFSLADNENTIIDNMAIYGGSTVAIKDASNFNFSKVSTLDVPFALENQWDSGYNTGNRLVIESGDVVIITFWAKRNSDASELFLFSEDSNNFDKEFYFSFGLSPDWAQYFMAFEAKQDYPVNSMSLGFHLGSVTQNFDIAGYTMLNYKKNYELGDVPSSFDSGSYGGSDPDADWRAPASERIEKLRKSDLDIRIVDESGNGVEGAEIKLEMEEHLFGFGSAFVTCRFPGNDCFDATYVEKVSNLDGEGHGFNVGVTENAVKWDAWEEEWIGSPIEAANAIEYLNDNGVTMRGHTLIWPGFDNMPQDIQQNKNDLEYIRQRLVERIETMINHPRLKDIIKEWDVLNEITVNRDLEEAFRNDPNFTTGREIYQEIFAKARAFDPEIKLYMNDFVVFSGGGSSTSVIDRYKSFLGEINASEQPMDGIGFQCHIGSNPTSIYILQEVLDEFHSTFNVPIKITEYDLNELVKEEDAANYLSDFLTMIFSHEAVNAFIMWGFWDGNHWKANAPIFEEDWSLKPSGQAFIDKVFGEWWTNETVQSDENGNARIRAFKGTHKITVTKSGKSKVAQVSLDNDGNVQITLEGLLSSQEDLNSSISILSNPVTSDYIQLVFSQEVVINSVDIISLEGKLIKSFNNISQSGALEVGQEKGVYLLNIHTAKGLVIKKVILQ